jgi:DNA-binding GntR family transcriptional regulator
MPRRSIATRATRSARRGSEAPLYRRVVQTLKQEIVSGIYPIDSQLPPEGALQQRFNVSRHTIREALRELRDAGLVASRQGFGTTVLRPGAPHPYVHEVASISDLIELANASRYEPASSEIVVADRELAARLDGALGARWLKVEGFRYAPDHGRPVCWTQVFVHADFAGVARLIGRRPGPIYLWIEDLYGESVAEVEQSLRASRAPHAIAATLGVEPDDTLIEVQRRYRLSSGVVAEVAVNLYPAERFELTMTLRRSKT